MRRNTAGISIVAEDEDEDEGESPPIVRYRSHAQHTLVPKLGSVWFVTMHLPDEQSGFAVQEAGMSESILSL
jgi:hypothetical protein